MDVSLLSGLFLGGALGSLACERALLEKRLRALPIRVAVTGTRGKTTLVTLLAELLRESGRRVFGKVTGSEPAELLPDGSRVPLRRRGRPSIMEQKRLPARAARAKAEVLVAEIMSIHRENHWWEGQRLLQPHLVLVTNFRVDHLEAQGRSRAEVASVLALAVPRGATALVPEAEWEPAFEEAVMGQGGVVEKVPAGMWAGGIGAGGSRGESSLGPGAGGVDRVGARGGLLPLFPEQLDLAWAAGLRLGIEADRLRASLRRRVLLSPGLAPTRGTDAPATPFAEDPGVLRAWRLSDGVAGERWLAVNAFAANDPESTLRVWERVRESVGPTVAEWVGLLCLRWDRPDRTALWVEALAGGALERFGRLYVVGGHSGAARRRLRRHPLGERVHVLRVQRPERLTEQVLGSAGADRGRKVEPGGPPRRWEPRGQAGRGDGDTRGSGGERGNGGGPPLRILFGFGNLVGLGDGLARYWAERGEPHGL